MLLIFTGTLSGQSALMDSLQQRLEENISPIHEIDVLLGMCRLAGFSGDWSLLEEKAQRAIQLSKAQGYERGMIWGYISLSNKAGEAGDIDASLGYMQQAIEVVDKSKDKSTEVAVMYWVAEHYLYYKNDLDTAIVILQSAIDKATRLTPLKDIGNVYKNLGICYDDLGEDTTALSYFDLALDYYQRPFIYDELGGSSALEVDNGQLNSGQIYIYKGTLFQNQGRYEEGIITVEKALAIYQRLEMPFFIAWAYENLGILYRLQGKTKEAVEYFQAAKLIYEESGDLFDLAYIYQYMGKSYMNLADYEEGANYYLKSLNTLQLTTDTIAITDAHTNYGFALINLKNWSDATYHLQQAEKLTNAIGSRTMLPFIYTGLGKIYEQERKIALAESYFKQAVEIAMEFKDYANAVVYLIDLSRFYLRKGLLNDANQYAVQALSYQNFTSIYQQERVYLLLSEIHEQKEDYKKAHQYYKSYFVAHDSIYTQDAQTTLRREQVRQDVATYKAEKEVAALRVELLSSRNRWYFISALTLLVLLISSAYLVWQLRKTQKVLQIKNQQLESLNQTKDKFFGIIAHDIRSPILALENVGEQMDYYLEKNNIKKLTQLSDKITNTAKRLTTLLDNLLNWALLQQGVFPYQPKPLSLNGLIEQNIQLFQMSANLKAIDLKNSTKEDLKISADENALNTILRNLISNAIKFTPKGGTVRIDAMTNQDNILISVQDTGIGMNEQQLQHLFKLDAKSQDGTAGERGTGLGLVLCKELLKMSRGKLDIKSVPQVGSDFRVILPTP